MFESETKDVRMLILHTPHAHIDKPQKKNSLNYLKLNLRLIPSIKYYKQHKMNQIDTDNNIFSGENSDYRKIIRISENKDISLLFSSFFRFIAF